MDDKNNAEREALREYLARNNSSLDSVAAEIGAGSLEQMLGKFALMESLIQEAVTAARTKDMDRVAHYLGAGAKRVKDEVYVVLIEAAGGIQAFSKRSMTPNEARLRDYISQKYAGGQRQCELILSV